MSEQEQTQIKWLTAFSNKALAIIVTGICTGLFMTFMFMTSIQNTMDNMIENNNLKFMGVDKQFERVDKRMDKIEDKTDEIRRSTVPLSQQVQEDRKRDPNF